MFTFRHTLKFRFLSDDINYSRFMKKTQLYLDLLETILQTSYCTRSTEATHKYRKSQVLFRNNLEKLLLCFNYVPVCLVLRYFLHTLRGFSRTFGCHQTVLSRPKTSNNNFFVVYLQESEYFGFNTVYIYLLPVVQLYGRLIKLLLLNIT